jgi:hypothetical protein
METQTMTPVDVKVLVLMAMKRYPFMKAYFTVHGEWPTEKEWKRFDLLEEKYMYPEETI